MDSRFPRWLGRGISVFFYFPSDFDHLLFFSAQPKAAPRVSTVGFSPRGFSSSLCAITFSFLVFNLPTLTQSRRPKQPRNREDIFYFRLTSPQVQRLLQLHSPFILHRVALPFLDQLRSLISLI
jgi:hypothetical protein